MGKYKVDISGIKTSDLVSLTQEEMNKLFISYKDGNIEAREFLINGNLKLVLSVIKKFYNKAENLDDLFQIGCVGLIKAIDNCAVKPDYVLTDAMKLDLNVPVKPIIKGDLRSITISAASVLAKVTRDNYMYELDKKYPMYDFKNNVGYPTKKHLEAIKKYGIIKEHRRSYGPVKEYMESNKLDNS